jgi:hypothetical protein
MKFTIDDETYEIEGLPPCPKEEEMVCYTLEVRDKDRQFYNQIMEVKRHMESAKRGFGSERAPSIFDLAVVMWDLYNKWRHWKLVNKGR